MASGGLVAGHGRNFGLDVLRCLAIAVVLANHAFLGFFVEYGNTLWEGGKAAWSIAAILSVEWLFVLSGFLIGTMMIRSFEKEGSWWTRARSFWLRRWFRTMPNYYLFLAVNALIVALGIREDSGFKWSFAVFSQNLAWAEEYPFFFAEAWSLALDEWFYLAMPLLLLVLALALRSSRLHSRFLLATAALILLPTVMRATADAPTSLFDWDFRIRRVTVMHLDATGWGVLGAVTSRWHPWLWKNAVGAKAAAGLGLTGLGLLMIEQLFFGGIFAERLPWVTSTFALTCIGLGTFLCLPWIARARSPHERVRKLVQSMSDYTYSIYLTHLPVLFVVVWVLGAPLTNGETLLGIVVWLPLVLLVAMGVHHSFEKPMSDLRERFTERVPAAPFQAAHPSAPASVGDAAPGKANPIEEEKGEKAEPSSNCR